MRLPAKKKYARLLFIGGEEWTLIFKPALKHRGQTVWGLTDPKKRIIYIHAKARKRMRLRTWIHEVLHAIHFEHGFKLRHRTVYKLEKAIFDLLMENF